MLEFYIHSLAGIAFLLGLSDITSLGCSVTCTFLSLPFFFTAEMFLYQFFLCAGFPATQNTCDRYNELVTDHLKIILCTIGNL